MALRGYGRYRAATYVARKVMALVSLARTRPIAVQGTITAGQAPRDAWLIRSIEIDSNIRIAVAIFGITGWPLEGTADIPAAMRQGLGRQWPRVIFQAPPSRSSADRLATSIPARPFTRRLLRCLGNAALAAAT
jgi:hypothetical protein